MRAGRAARLVAYTLVASTLFAASVVAAQDPAPIGPPPVNTDPLTERGINPRALDLALYILSQGPGFEMLFEYERRLGDAEPATDRGRLVRPVRRDSRSSG